MSSTATATATSTPSVRAPLSSPSDVTGYKGKVTRSWAQLPPEIIRHIASHYLTLVSPFLYTPSTWDIREYWHSRIIFTALRDAGEVEKLMAICTPWSVALEYHPFWQHACAALDPNEALAHHAIIRSPPTAGSNKAPVLRLPPYRHFRQMATYSCMVCRLNFSGSNLGFGVAKRVAYNPQLNMFTVCREHRKGTFCALCLRAAPPDDTHLMVCVAENEDEETWPGVEATCRNCRAEGLWRRAVRDPLDRQALGSNPLKWKHAPDWEIGQAVETFVDMGEGCISDVLALAREKHWLRSNTKIAELLSQALASSRYVARAEAGYEGDSDEDLSGEEEEDPELMSLTEDAGGIRELAIADWARNRILDGHWIAPADQWYNHSVPDQPAVVPAQHPCPWHGATYSGALEDGESAGDGSELAHPRPRTSNAPCPPTFALCEVVYRNYQRVMREILLPAMSNIVRRILMESQADGVDPTLRTSKMTLEEVVKELRDHATWLKGVDWLERRVVREREERQRRQRSVDEDSSSSSRSSGSHETSPVLSTTTLQTTPSPPPSSVKDEDSESSPVAVSSPAIPVSEAALQTHELIRPIPYVPITIAHLPQYSIECVRTIWREACTPLYQCRCSICERTMLAANTNPPNPSQRSANRAPAEDQERPTRQRDGETQEDPKQLVIKIEEASLLTLRQEEEEDDLDADADLDLDVDDYELESELDESTVQQWPGETISTPRTPKRTLEDMADAVDSALQGDREPVEREDTPPKRARLADAEPIPKQPATPSSIRLRKRSSEELEDSAVVGQNGKRVKA
ncbi:hypothetical protein PsYK624_135420 [Phanerochaete sordida]|uniref:Uncharacterized protein n=1 Tax=Phanerochaete sordida TaxID=48140 RepID=A0A9P3GLR4_9APHY|nr:hypothetical protein PsYK624_135420 [Phanerochaete sordida]